MKAFKFRSAAQVELAFDILLNKRLYCADWSNLNDPMEGRFLCFNRESEDARFQIVELIEKKKKMKICSLSGTIESSLLWAHYAGSFDGLAIEVELPEIGTCVKKVNYRQEIPIINANNMADVGNMADEILTTKYEEWNYEQEVRIIQHESIWFKIPQPRRVVLGPRMPDGLAQAIKIVCDSQSIEVERLYIDGAKFDLCPYII